MSFAEALDFRPGDILPELPRIVTPAERRAELDTIVGEQEKILERMLSKDGRTPDRRVVAVLAEKVARQKLGMRA